MPVLIAAVPPDLCPTAPAETVGGVEGLNGFYMGLGGVVVLVVLCGVGCVCGCGCSLWAAGWGCGWVWEL